MSKKKEQQFLSAYDAFADELFRQCAEKYHSRQEALSRLREIYCQAWEKIAKGAATDNLYDLLRSIAQEV